MSAQQLLDSARLISRETAVQKERAWNANNKKRLNTPLVKLEEYLKQPHKEITLANGILKIVTPFGEYCFLPIPYFGQQTPAVFGVTSTCP